MSFIANNVPPTPDDDDVTIQNYAFFPALSLMEFRIAMRVDNVTTAPRAQHALMAAMIEVNTRLANWMATHITNGVISLAQVPEKPGHPEGANTILYLRAIWSLAKAQLIERNRDYDSTKSGHDKADELEPAADDYRRDAAWAINDLMNIPRTTIELI